MTNDKALELIVRGIKCDADCDYHDDTVEFSEGLLGVPCPKCGAPLLTEKDLLAIRALKATNEWINAIVGPAKEGDDDRTTILHLGMDGSGEITMEIGDTLDSPDGAA